MTYLRGLASVVGHSICAIILPPFPTLVPLHCCKCLHLAFTMPVSHLCIEGVVVSRLLLLLCRIWLILQWYLMAFVIMRFMMTLLHFSSSRPLLPPRFCVCVFLLEMQQRDTMISRPLFQRMTADMWPLFLTLR
jgi:hypothetical protein